MTLIRDTLIQIRTELGFESAKAFYRFLESRRALEFNYGHYMKVEGAKALPSPAMISTLGSVLGSPHADRLTLAYCETQFPNQRHLFKAANIPTPPASKPASTQTRSEAGEGATLIRQQLLTEAQIAAICRSPLHYSLFLILTLARGAVEPARLKDLLQAKASEVEASLRDLEKARLTRTEDQGVASIAKEMRFPKAETDSIRRMYEQIDQWNFDFDKRVGLAPVLQKMMIRRVSARYLGVIQRHCDVLLDLIRAAEEINPEYNDDVLMLNFTLSSGKLPG